MTAAKDQFILDERTGRDRSIAILTLNRPARANAIIPDMARQIQEAIEAVGADKSVKGIVLTGAGKHFCPGMDGNHALQMAEDMAKGSPPAEPFEGNLRYLHAATVAVFESDKPVIAALNGSAAAGGLDLALACDCRLAIEGAMFAESYVKLGLPPLNGGAWLLKRVIGPSHAARMLMTGERVDAQRALAMGLVDEIVPADKLIERAVALAEQMSSAPSSLNAFLKRELRAEGSLPDALARAYIEGIASLRSEAFLSAIQQLKK